MAEDGHIPSFRLHLAPFALAVHREGGVLKVPPYCDCVPLAVVDRRLGHHGGGLGAEDGEAEAELAVEDEQLQEVAEALVVEVNEQAMSALGFHVKAHLAFTARVPHGEPGPLALSAWKLETRGCLCKTTDKQTHPEDLGAVWLLQTHGVTAGSQMVQSKNLETLKEFVGDYSEVAVL